MAGLNREFFDCVQLNITNLVNILYTMTQTYRLLVGGAEEFARIGLAPKHDKEEAIDRADDMGDIIDKVIKKLDCQTTIFLQLFEPEIICALPTPTPCPTTTPCPTPTPCPTATPTGTSPPRENPTQAADASMEFIALQGELAKTLESLNTIEHNYQIEKELNKELGIKNKMQNFSNKEDKDEDN